MRKASFKGGIHLHGYKELTSGKATIPARIPDKVYIPLSQHIGAPCASLVLVGDEVKKGQRIGEGKDSLPLQFTLPSVVKWSPLMSGSILAAPLCPVL